GALPAGITIAANGPGCLISGTPTAPGGSTFGITVSNNQGQTTAARSLILSVFGITTASVPAGTLNTPYSFQFQASGGEQYQWSLLSGALPTGLVLNSNGLLTGNPQSSGVFPFTVRVTESGLGLSDARSLSIAIGGAGGQFQIVAGTLPDAPLNQNYTAT